MTQNDLSDGRDGTVMEERWKTCSHLCLMLLLLFGIKSQNEMYSELMIRSLLDDV